MRRDKDKFKEHSRRCVFVGYPFGKRGWKLFDLETHEIFVSRDVVFNETSFPYHSEQSPERVLPMEPVCLPGVPDVDINNYETSQAVMDSRGSFQERDTDVAPVSDAVEVESSATVPMVPERTAAFEPMAQVEPVAATETVAESKLGRGQRVPQASVKLRDYVCYNSQRHPDKHRKLFCSGAVIILSKWSR